MLYWILIVSKKKRKKKDNLQLDLLSFLFVCFFHSFIIKVLPIDVQILTNRTKLLAGRKIDINCQTYGSKPAAIIKWFHNDKQLITTASNTIESYESNKTFSSITFKPTVYDNGSLLKCRAYNPRIQLNKKFSTTTTTNTTATITAENIDDENRNYIESIWRLEVLCKLKKFICSLVFFHYETKSNSNEIESERILIMY